MRRLLPLLPAGLLSFVFSSTAMAAPPFSEAAVKAAFVYNFAKFVEWPSETFPVSDTPIILCLLGRKDPFLSALMDIDGKTAQQRPLRVRKTTAQSDFQGCQILVVGESERHRLPEVLRSLRAAGTLVVGEFDGFIDGGGAIGLLTDEERVQFEINLQAAQRANLSISSQLLKLARRITR